MIAICRFKVVQKLARGCRPNALPKQPPSRGVPGTGFWNGTSTLKQYFVLSKNGSKYYLKYTFLAFPVLGILGPSTPLPPMVHPQTWLNKQQLLHAQSTYKHPKANSLRLGD